MDPEIGATYASLLYIVEGAEDYNTGKAEADVVAAKALDDKTFQVTLKSPAPYFLEQLTHQTSFPVPQHVLNRYSRTSQEWSQPENIVGQRAVQNDRVGRQCAYDAGQEPRLL